MSGAAEEQDRAVRIAVYEATVDRGTPPLVAELSGRLDLPPEAVRASLERLAEGRALVLQPDSREILMASPFSAVPTPFAAEVRGRLYFANCIWDAFGIPAMLGTDARISASCGCCGEAMRASVGDGALDPLDGVVHFAVPAHRWWQDIVYN
jgi:hypothetical protein